MSPLRRDIFGNARIAHRSLKGAFEADRFTNGQVRRVGVPVANLKRHPIRRGLDRQILFGHSVTQLDPYLNVTRDDTTGYVGYVHPARLAPWVTPTHRVTARTTYLFSAPDFKAPNPVALSCGSLLSIASKHGKYVCTQDGQYAFMAHLADIKEHEPDLSVTAAKLIGAPYLWGGNSAFGIDCSGLIQNAMQAAGLPCPGDSDQQLDQCGEMLAPGTPAKRNDLMFWKGHVALVYDSTTLIHANAHHMAVAFEHIKDALNRIQQQGDGPCLGHKRLLA